MASSGPSAVELMRALAEGPAGSSEALEAWDKNWAALFEKAIHGDIDEDQSADLTKILEQLTEVVAAGETTTRSTKRSTPAKRATAKTGAAAKKTARATAPRSAARRLSVGDEFKIRTRSGVRVVEVVEVLGSKAAPRYRVRHKDGHEEMIDPRKSSRIRV